MKKTKPWSDDDAILLDRMIKQGYSSKLIGEMLGKSRSYISQKKKALGYQLVIENKWSNEEEVKLRNLYYKGYTDEQIAKELDRGVQAVYCRRIQLGYNDLKNIDWDEEFIQKYIIKQLNSCNSRDEASTKTGLSSFTIHNKLKEYFNKKIISKEIYDEIKKKVSRKVVKI